MDEIERRTKDAARNHAIQVALSDHIPVDDLGYPVGRTTVDTVKAIKPPMGITRREWVTAIEVATEYFRLTAGIVPPTKDGLMGISSLDERVWNVIYNEVNLPDWEAALAIRGILKKGSGLTADQLQTLRYLTDLTKPGTLDTKLKRLGVSWETFQNWSKDKRFKEQLNQRAEQILDEAQPHVNMAIAKGAIDGKLPMIQYFHQITGKHQKDGQNDVDKFLVGLVEILQGEIQDAELLRKIAGRLQSLKDRINGGDTHG